MSVVQSAVLVLAFPFWELGLATVRATVLCINERAIRLNDALGMECVPSSGPALTYQLE